MVRRMIRLSVLAFVVIAILATVARAQQASIEEGMTASTLSVYTPPTCVPGVPFSDITCTTGFDPWIEQFGLDGITAGCGGGNYCPGTPVTRNQMAVFIEKAMRGTSNWPPHTVLVFHHPAAEANSDVNSGTELLSMVAAIPSSGSEAPSATNPWLIEVGPGIYDLGSGSLTLPAYTDLEGAGQDITVITATGNANYAHATVVMEDHGKLSRITVNNSGGDASETAVYLPSLASRVALEHVTLTASNPSNASGGAYGLYADVNTSFSLVDCELAVHGGYTNWGIEAMNSTDESRLDGVLVHVSGSNSSGLSYGFWGADASPVITNSRFYVQDGAYPYGIVAAGGGSALELRNSEVYTLGPNSVGVTSGAINATLLGDLISSGGNGVVTGGGSGLSADISNCNIIGHFWLYNGSGYTVTVGASKLIGGTANNVGTVKCFGNYTATAFLLNNCP